MKKSAIVLAVLSAVLFAVSCQKNDSPDRKKIQSDQPPGALPGKFTIYTGKQVYFSQGNLYWNGYLFKFETNQYDVRNDVRNTSRATHVSLFYWSMYAEDAVKDNYNYARPRSERDIFFTNVDGFTVNVGSESQTKWRTLTKYEWQYLIEKRTVNGGTGEGHSYSYNITYGGKKGLVIYPDTYDKAPISGTVTELPEGVVFLPATDGDIGGYWSSAPSSSDMAEYMYFRSDFVNGNARSSRDLTWRIRLVIECQ